MENVQDRLYRGSKLRNTLIQIELDKRAATDLAHSTCPQIRALEETVQQQEVEILQLVSGIKKQNSHQRKRQADPEQADKLRELRVAQSAAKKTLHEEKSVIRKADGAAKADPVLASMEKRYAAMSAKGGLGPNNKIRKDLKDEIKLREKQITTGLAAELLAIKTAAIAQSKQAKDQSGLYWSHIGAIDKDVSRACKKQPRFRRYDGCGSLYIQIQGGLPTDKLDTSNFFRLIGEGRKRTVYFRIASSGRDPVWAVVPIVYHRDLPTARIKGVRLTRKRTATHTYWEVQIECEAHEFADDRTNNNDCVSIDLGWRVTENGIRVATWMGNDTDGGGKGELVIPWMRDKNNQLILRNGRPITRWDQIKGLQSIRDAAFEAVRDLLRDWLRTHEIPEWLREKTTYLHQWRSQRRLAGLILLWQRQRFDGDEAIYTYLNGPLHKVVRFVKGKDRLTRSGWRNWDKHLYEWCEQARKKAERYRKDLYLKFIAQLKRRYGAVRLEDARWDRMSMKAQPEEESNDWIRRYQRIASPGMFRSLCKEKFTNYQEIKSAGTTSTCNECGAFVEVGSGEWGKCGCGASWNRDKNACYNILMSPNVTKSSGPVTQETPAPLEPCCV